MEESGKKGNLLKKSYEIAYALWRTAANIQERNFADKLFGKSVDLLAFAADGNYKEIAAILPGVEFLVKFGADVNYINPSNAAILSQEIGNLHFMIAGMIFTAETNSLNATDELDLSDIFSKGYSENEGFPETKIDVDPVDSVGAVDAAEVGHAGESHLESHDDSFTSVKADIRQSTILNRIRQSGNCRLGDIAAILPGVSERTIRYDLESLVTRNLVERVGTGGRSVYYRPAPGDTL